MANTTKMSGKFISITLDGATDWSITQDMPQFLPGGFLVKRIGIYCASAADAVKIRNAETAAQTAAYICMFTATAEVLSTEVYFGDGGSWMFPAFDAADLTEATDVVIETV